MVRTASLVLLGFSTFAITSCKKSAPADVAATVNGRPITYVQLEKQLKLSFAGAQERPQEDQLSIQKMELLRGMIDREVMLQRAEKLGLMATDADVEAKFNSLKAPYTEDQFKEQLRMREMSADDLKAEIRREESIEKLINKEIKSHISVTDAEISEFYKNNREMFNLAEPQIHLAQIVVTPATDNVRNLKNDDATTIEAAQKKIATIEARLRQGEDFAMLAQNFSEDPQTAPSGGDLGFVPESSLQRLGPDFSRYILGVPPGQNSRILPTGQDFRILRVISKEPAGQRELTDPKVQQSIRENLMNRKDQLLRAAYYEVARNEADVKNYYAASIVERHGATRK
jgi:peptidyl-prolyl cis-trans isomerase SurA